MNSNQRKGGFTLIELLIVIGIIGFLAAAILVAVDPVKRIQDSRDAKRWAEVNGVLNSILTKQVDDRRLYNGDTVTAPILTGTLAQVLVADASTAACTVATTRPGCDVLLDISGAKTCVADLDTGTTTSLIPYYLAELPQDPRSGETPCAVGSGCAVEGAYAIGTTNSGYYIKRTTGNRIEIGACSPEQAAAISVKR